MNGIGINNKGDIAGYYGDWDGRSHAFVLRDGVFTTIDPPDSRGATAYRTALEPALTLPLFETDPDLTDITTATEAFTEWRAAFESVRAALPSGIADQASSALETISAGLETTQTAYLDAIRTDNRTAAVEIVGTLRADLLGVRQAMLTDFGAVSDSVSALIEEARTDLSRLLG